MFAFDAEKSTIHLYDEIGPERWGLIDESMVSAALAAMPKNKPIAIHLNTPGGSCDIGVGIYNMLANHKGGVTMVVDSLAASMGSYLLQAGTTRAVYENSIVMIHDPWTMVMGNAAGLRKEAEVLDKYASRMVPAYAQRSGKESDEILSIMAEETWYVGQEIIDAGFADELITGDAQATLQPHGAIAAYCKAPMPDKIASAIREANERGRLHDKLLSVGVDKNQWSVETAKARIAKRLAECEEV